MFLCWFSTWRIGPSLENPAGSCAFNWRSYFQSGALKDGMPVQFLLDNLFPSVRVALFLETRVFRSVLSIRYEPTYLATDTTL